MDYIERLETVEKLAAGTGADYRELRKRADALYGEAVARIARERGCGVPEAHALAGSDPVAKRAYAILVDLAEREAGLRDQTGTVAAFMS